MEISALGSVPVGLASGGLWPEPGPSQVRLSDMGLSSLGWVASGLRTFINPSNMFATGSLLARCLYQRHKLLPQWIWERVPDPANSNSGQPYIKVRKMAPVGATLSKLEDTGAGGREGPLSFKLPFSQEVSLPQPPKDGPILEVEEMELQPVTESPKASVPLYSGYEKHFLPTPEELGLLRPPAPRVLDCSASG